jgi:hypothetical protein
VKPVILLAEALEDLENARDFYDRQQQGVGDYCVGCLIADMEKLADYHGIHPKHFGAIACSPPDFRSACTIKSSNRQSVSLLFLTCAATRPGFVQKWTGVREPERAATQRRPGCRKT